MAACWGNSKRRAASGKGAVITSFSSLPRRRQHRGFPNTQTLSSFPLKKPSRGCVSLPSTSRLVRHTFERGWVPASALPERQVAQILCSACEKKNNRALLKEKH